MQFLLYIYSVNPSWKMIRKKVFLLLFILLVSINTYADETLINIIRDRDWDKLPSLFLDNSYTSLQDNFSFFKSIKIEKGKFGKFVYIMKFKNHGEIGIVLFNKKNGKYLNLQITNRIRPLNFVDKFNKYKANNVKINVGDAQIHFIKGVFYEAHPFNTLILFEGKWNFSIEPNDKEEKLTLNRIFRKKRFSKLNTTGIFLLKDRNFLKSLPSDNENSDLDLELKTLYNFFQSRYG